ncbi:hypothetical protein V8C26DRAFT_393789, partial [Trichoderma gracile]
MAQKLDKDIYAKVNSFYGLNRHPIKFKADLITKDTPIVRYIAAEAQESGHLVFEIAPVEHPIIVHTGLSFWCTSAEVEAMMEEMQGQHLDSDMELDGDIREMIEKLSNCKDHPSVAYLRNKTHVYEWVVPKQRGSDGAGTDGTLGRGHDGGTGQRLDGVQGVQGSGLVGGDAVQTTGFVDGEVMYWEEYIHESQAFLAVECWVFF